jgi:predicted CoA-binding protein
MKKIQPILNFLEGKEFAMAGVSRNPKKFGGTVFAELTQKGYTIYPVNPNTDKIGDHACYKDIASLPGHVKKLVVMTPKNETRDVVEQAVQKGIHQIWIQQMSDSPEAIKLAEDNHVELVTGECIYMHAEPVSGFHKFHRSIRKLFGMFPR